MNKPKALSSAIPDTAATYEHAACGLVTTELNGTIVKANTTFCKWMGIEAGELLYTRRIQDLLTVGGRVFHQTHWAPLMQLQGTVAEVQLDLKTAQGTVLPMLVNASRIEFQQTQYDQLALIQAADRKSYERELLKARRSVEDSLLSLHETQQQLRQANEFLSVAIRSARMGVWSQDLASGQVKWSTELQMLTGITDTSRWSSSDAFLELIHPDDRHAFITELALAIKHEADYDIEFRLQHSDGSWLDMEGRGHGSYAESGEAVSIFGIFTDISGRKAAERELFELNQKLREADKRKDQFLATLGHELRNPLAPIQNVLEIIRTKDPQEQWMRWSKEVIERHVSQMTHLVEDLMEASRISQGRLSLRKKKVDVADIMQSAVEASHGIIEENKHHITVSQPETPVLLHADPTRLIQVLSNLLTNAAKYTPVGGKISLQAQVSGMEIRFTITDTGIGIPEDQLSHIFGMFSQLEPAIERAQGGLGIGLALAAKLVEMHGGSISAHSEGIGKGSTFTVTMPLAEDQSGAVTVTPREPETVTPKLRILVIDDNVDAAESLAMLFDLNGHTTRFAHDGASGVKSAASFNPDVVLSDIGLPDISGYEVAKALRDMPNGHAMLLVATTGWGQEKDKVLAKQAGFDKHFTKPLDFQALKRFLHQHYTKASNRPVPQDN
ncbi:ATP-binding protein [Alteromonas sp. ASW11-19]|uniref:histidine kinase n=1 Tax=Alteromonas salexigens TaxID=2982530 RepID=A0ABT2VLF2_9ALTE|nr:ATP-binding protein [Alteromonas salexigens]MCU7554140.1 ATP-binding protein [Alteromonas salexigens]